MNSIRRPRRRPRRRSLSFRTFAWLMVREAALRVCYPVAVGGLSEPAARFSLVGRPTGSMRSAVDLVLTVRPERQFYDGPGGPGPGVRVDSALVDALLRELTPAELVRALPGRRAVSRRKRRPASGEG